MYRCQICNHVSQPHEPRKVHVVHRDVPGPYGGTRQEIAREIPVCAGCQKALDSGEKTLEQLTRHHQMALLFAEDIKNGAWKEKERRSVPKSGVSVMFS